VRMMLVSRENCGGPQPVEAGIYNNIVSAYHPRLNVTSGRGFFVGSALCQKCYGWLIPNLKEAVEADGTDCPPMRKPGKLLVSGDVLSISIRGRRKGQRGEH